MLLNVDTAGFQAAFAYDSAYDKLIAWAATKLATKRVIMSMSPCLQKAYEFGIGMGEPPRDGRVYSVRYFFQTDL